MHHLLSAAVIVASIQSAMQEPILPGKLVVWLLFVLSIVSWVMMISKSLQLGRMKRADNRFSERLRKSQTTLEVFEEGWRDESSLQLIIYHSGARETAFQLLGSRNPAVGMSRDIREAGQLSSKQYGFLESAFRAGYRTAVTKLTSGIQGLKFVGVSAVLLGMIGCVWTLMAGFDTAGEERLSGTVIGTALGFVAISLLVATPALLGRIALTMVIEKRQNEVRKFRDDIACLFERKFATLETPAQERSSDEEPQEARVTPSGKLQFEEPEPIRDDFDDEPPSSGGKKQYHSIRDRLLNLPDDGDAENELSMNPIARQAATVGPRS